MKNLIVLLLLLVMSLAYVNSDARTYTISVQNYSYTPDVIYDAVVGDTLKWVWVNGTHSVTSGLIPFDAMPFDAFINSSSTTYSYVLQFSGDYYYFCRLHPEVQVGIIYVSPLTTVEPKNTFVRDYSLKQNFPNPFNPVTKISFDIPKPDVVTLKIYDLSGKEMTTLVNSELNAGSYEITFDGSKYASGTYFYRITTGKFTETKRMLLIK